MRYYSNNNSNNYPGQLTLELLRNGTAFTNAYPIAALNIQSMPGVKFYINGSMVPFIIDNSKSCTIENYTINSILFDEESLNKIVTNNSYLIINYK